jgi:signal transduction histidine kinase
MILTGVEFTISTTGTSLTQKMPIEFRRNLILIYKEILNNIARHAQARTVAISLGQHDSMFTLRVEDDGRGFDRDHVARGHGLNSLNERAARVGGVLSVDSVPGRGTVVTFTVRVP